MHPVNDLVHGTPLAHNYGHERRYRYDNAGVLSIAIGIVNGNVSRQHIFQFYLFIFVIMNDFSDFARARYPRAPGRKSESMAVVFS